MRLTDIRGKVNATILTAQADYFLNTCMIGQKFV